MIFQKKTSPRISLLSCLVVSATFAFDPSRLSQHLGHTVSTAELPGGRTVALLPSGIEGILGHGQHREMSLDVVLARRGV